VCSLSHTTREERREKREESRVEKQVLLIRCVPPPHFDRFGPYYICTVSENATSTTWLCHYFSKAMGTMVPLHDDSSMNTAPETTRRKAQRGDVVTIDFSLMPENGYVPHPLFDTSGKVSFVLGCPWGGYLPGLHALIQNMEVGQDCHNVSIDAGWGSRNPELVVKIGRNKLKYAVEGTKLHIQGMTLEVMEITDDYVVV
jgi:hypothetical protein